MPFNACVCFHAKTGNFKSNTWNSTLLIKRHWMISLTALTMQLYCSFRLHLCVIKFHGFFLFCFEGLICWASFQALHFFSVQLLLFCHLTRIEIFVKSSCSQFPRNYKKGGQGDSTFIFKQRRFLNQILISIMDNFPSHTVIHPRVLPKRLLVAWQVTSFITLRVYCLKKWFC